MVDELNEISVPAGPVLSIPDILRHSQITERGLLETLKNIPGLEKNIDILKTAVLFDGGRDQVDSNPPLLGEDNISVYSNLGLNYEEIKELKKEGVI